MGKTKIICTLGPASDSKEVIIKLIDSGMDISRHNFSHGSYEENGSKINLVKELREEMNKPIEILLDTKGPEVRTGKFTGDSVTLVEGSSYTVICGEDIIGNETTCSISYKGLYKDAKIGDSILIADGLIGLEIKEINQNKIHCVVKNTGTIGNYKNVNVPGVVTKLPAIGEKDFEDLKFGIHMGVDIVAASFVRKAEDVLEIKKVLNENDLDLFTKNTKNIIFK